MDTQGLTCPKCGYELTGLREPCCPECGEAFDPVWLRGMTRKYPGILMLSPWFKWTVLYLGLGIFVVVLMLLLKDAGTTETQIGVTVFIAASIVALTVVLRWLRQDHL